MVWQTLNAKRAPENTRYTKNFLIVAPGLIVYERLLDAFQGKERDGKRDFARQTWRVTRTFYPGPLPREVFRFVQGAVCPKEESGEGHGGRADCH